MREPKTAQQTRPFDRTQLLAAFDAIGTAAVVNGTRLEIAVDDGSALMLASNFRFTTKDVDVAAGSRWSGASRT